MSHESTITLGDIAKRLGCHKSTVSMALRGHSRIPAKTVERVRQMAEKLGYRPDPALARLSAIRWKGMDARPAVSVAFVARARTDYPSMRGKLEACAERWVRGAGYGFERVFLEDYPSGAAAARVLRARGVAGLIVMASAQENAFADFRWSDWPAVQVMEGISDVAGVPIARSDEFGAMMDAGRRVEASGARTAAICLVRGRGVSHSDEHTLAGALLVTSAWRRARIVCEEPRVFQAAPNRDVMAEIAEWLVARRPEAAIVSNSSVDVRLRELGVRPGRDLRLIAMHVLGRRGCAGYERDFEAICAAAAGRVDSMIRHGRRGTGGRGEVVLLPPVRVEADTFEAGKRAAVGR